MRIDASHRTVTRMGLEWVSNGTTGSTGHVHRIASIGITTIFACCGKANAIVNSSLISKVSLAYVVCRPIPTGVGWKWQVYGVRVASGVSDPQLCASQGASLNRTKPPATAGVE